MKFLLILALILALGIASNNLAFGHNCQMMISPKDFRIEDENFSNRASVGEPFEISGTLVNLDQNPKQLKPWAVITSPDRSFLINNIASFFPESDPTCWQSKSDGNLNWYFYLLSNPSDTFTLESNDVTDYQITLTPKKSGSYHIHSGMLINDYIRFGPGQTVYVEGNDAITEGEIFGFYLPLVASIALIIFATIMGIVLIRKKINLIKIFKNWKMKTKLSTLLIAIVAISLLVIVNYSEENLEEKYQYKFWRDEVLRVNTHSLQRVFFSYSHDYGQTFSEPKDVSMTEGFAHEPKMIEFDKDVILVWRDEVPGNSLLSFAISHDFGETFEKKRLFNFGSAGRPDIVHKNEILYMTWIEYSPFQVYYSKSYDRGETFEESTLIFSPEYDWDPTLTGPIPKFSQDSGVLKINWNFILEDYEYVIEE